MTVVETVAPEGDVLIVVSELIDLRGRVIAAGEDLSKAKVRIVCRQWEQVQGLCNDIKQGITCITVRARAMLEVEQTVTMQIALPDEMVITVDGLVVGSSPWDPDGKRPYQIDLVGFGNDQVFFLQSRCDQVIRSGALGRTTQSIPRTGTPEDRRTRPIRGSKKP